MKVVKLNRVSFAPSEASVTGPYRPTTPAGRTDWRNSDTLHPNTAMQAARIRNLPATSLPVVRPANDPVRPAQAAPVEQLAKPSFLRRLAGLVGVACCSIGVVGGLVSIAALGPLGIAVAAGAGLIGAVLIWAVGK